MYNLDDIILLNSIMNPTTDSIIVCIGLLFFFIYYIIWMSYVKKLKQLDPIVEKCRNKSEFFRNECDVLKKKLKAKIVTELVLKDLFLDSTSVFGILKGIYKYKTNDAIQELDDLSVILSYPVHFVETAKEMNALPVGLITKKTKLVKDVKKGEVITYDMVELDESSFILQLRRVQDKLFG